MDTISTDVLALRALQTRLLARFRCECIYQINDKFKDYEIAKLLGISATAFSLASTGVSTLSGPTFYKLICALIGLGVNVSEYFEMESITLDFIQKTHPENIGEIFNDSSAPPTGADEAVSGCPADCLGDCSFCAKA